MTANSNFGSYRTSLGAFSVCDFTDPSHRYGIYIHPYFLIYIYIYTYIYIIYFCSSTNNFRHAHISIYHDFCIV